MVNAFLNLALLVFLILPVSLASAKNLKISSESEALYFKALPYLEKIDEVQNAMFTVRRQLAPNEPFPPLKKEQYLDEVKALIKEGAPLVKRSAEEGNPAAQYRLALLLSTFESLDPSDERVCGLLRSSLSRGFTPAGLQMLAFCFEEVKTPEFRSLVDALPDDETLYGKYYPQPTILPICDSKSRSHGSAIIPLDEKGFRANLYMMLAIRLPRQSFEQERLRYLNKAAAYGCEKAVEQLKGTSKNYLRCHRCVKSRLGMLIYNP